MNTSQLKSQIVPLLHLAGLALVIIAALKYGGVRIGFGGNVTEDRDGWHWAVAREIGFTCNTN